ncbi:Zinc transporter ZIP11 [Takifugu flavidus]|uniref:Zinc transporter ZIP11 n=1 Tax=Takifugu flavidus TaxID=433684 RepID=A0A5C6PTC6_9TELE|nr:Zinc transporter ZIP11 [Takifugu flavidus]
METCIRGEEELSRAFQMDRKLEVNKQTRLEGQGAAGGEFFSSSSQSPSTTSQCESEWCPEGLCGISAGISSSSTRSMMLDHHRDSCKKGLAVGVGFGAIGKTPSATFESARNLAIGIGIQNFPEGLAVSLPLRGAGFSAWTAFWYGQLSGMVEPVAGLLGAFAVVLAEPLLPYALAFAAGAMVYVVVDDIIPEAQVSGNGKLASCTSILGFIVMMSLDVGLG